MVVVDCVTSGFYYFEFWNFCIVCPEKRRHPKISTVAESRACEQFVRGGREIRCNRDPLPGF